MAVKRKTDTAKPSLPEKLDSLLKAGFTANCLEKKYDEEASQFKKDIKDYLENNTDGFEVEISKGFKCDYGTVTLKSREGWDIDKDKVIALVTEGKLTLETLVNLVSFSADKLRTAVGDSTFEGLATKKPATEFIELRANDEFKGKIDAEFTAVFSDSKPTPVADSLDAALTAPVEAPKPKKKEEFDSHALRDIFPASVAEAAVQKKQEAEALEDNQDSLAKVRAARVKALSKKAAKSAAGDLDAIVTKAKRKKEK